MTRRKRVKMDDVVRRLDTLKRIEDQQHSRLSKLKCDNSDLLVDLSDTSGTQVLNGEKSAAEHVIANRKREKRPFLRKGQGLARFRMQLTDVRKKSSDPVAKPCPSEPSPSHYDDLKVFEILEQKVANTSFCSNSSSIDHLFSGSINNTENELQKRPYRYFSPKKRVSFNRNLDFDNDVNNENLKTLEEETDGSVEMSSATRLYMEDRSTDDVIFVQDAEVQCGKMLELKEIGTMTDDFDINPNGLESDRHQSQTLSSKMDELDREINILKQENSRVSQLKSSLEIEKKNFQRERDKLKKTQNTELESLRIDLEAEKSKSAKEKYSLETKIKNFKRQIATLKKQRSDTEELENQVKELKNELKLRDSKCGTIQVRLRNQISVLERQNEELKAEFEQLKRQNEKLRVDLKANRKLQGHTSDTKLLHEVNDMLSHFMQLNFNQKPLEEDINTPQETSPKMDESERIGRRENHLEDGSIERVYNNGNVKIISPDKKFIKVTYYNKDVKETFLDTGVVRYFYNETKIWQTSHPDGTEVFEYNTGEIETRKPNGSIEILYTNGTVKTVDKDKNESINLPDGSKVSIGFNGDKTLYLASGQREVHTKDYKRREWPDGTVKVLYKDGTQETVYSNGRVRVRNSHGDLVMDSYENCNVGISVK